jgi:hypothetical protein
MSMVHTPAWDEKQGYDQIICSAQPLHLSEIGCLQKYKWAMKVAKQAHTLLAGGLENNMLESQLCHPFFT